MKVRMRMIMPVLLALAGCASTTSPMAGDMAGTPQTSAVAPQRVTAAANALGQQLNAMMAAQGGPSATVLR